MKNYWNNANDNKRRKLSNVSPKLEKQTHFHLHSFAQINAEKSFMKIEIGKIWWEIGANLHLFVSSIVFFAEDNRNGHHGWHSFLLIFRNGIPSAFIPKSILKQQTVEWECKDSNNCNCFDCLHCCSFVRLEYEKYSKRKIRRVLSEFSFYSSKVWESIFAWLCTLFNVEIRNNHVLFAHTHTLTQRTKEKVMLSQICNGRQSFSIKRRLFLHLLLGFSDFIENDVISMTTPFYTRIFGILFVQKDFKFFYFYFCTELLQLYIIHARRIICPRKLLHSAHFHIISGARYWDKEVSISIRFFLSFKQFLDPFHSFSSFNDNHILVFCVRIIFTLESWWIFQFKLIVFGMWPLSSVVFTSIPFAKLNMKRTNSSGIITRRRRRSRRKNVAFDAFLLLIRFVHFLFSSDFFFLLLLLFQHHQRQCSVTFRSNPFIHLNIIWTNPNVFLLFIFFLFAFFSCCLLSK